MPVSSDAFHPLHRLWRAFPSDRRRILLAKLSARLAPRLTRPAPAGCDGVIVAGELHRASGLGEAARIMQRGFSVLAVPSWPLEAGLGVPGETGERPLSASMRGATGFSNRAALLLHVNAPVLPSALLRLPRRLVRGRRVIGYWNWELEVVPASWRPACGCVHEVWAPSRFTARALETLLPGRVRVVPLPLGLSPPEPSRLDRAAFGLPENAVVVLVSFSLASGFDRKNPLAAISAFRKAFGNRSDRIMVLKVGHSRHYGEDMGRLHDAIGGCSNIRMETRMLPVADTHALTRLCDIVLSLHRSEGFGLVPAEAMMLGRVVVSTDWSATAEYIAETCGVPVGFRLVPARDRRGAFEAPGAVWADADIDAAARALELLADFPERRAALGAQARRVARARFSGEELRRALQGIGFEGSVVPSGLGLAQAGDQAGTGAGLAAPGGT